MGESKPEAGTGERAQGTKQPYVKPAVSWEEGLEVRPGLIVACNKVTIAELGCDTGVSS